jgi:hypothetical protein
MAHVMQATFPEDVYFLNQKDVASNFFHTGVWVVGLYVCNNIL